MDALIVSPIPFWPDWEGNRKRVGQMVSVLMEMGYRVHFLHVRHDEGSPEGMACRINGEFYSLPDQKRAHMFRPWLIQTRLAKLTRQYKFCNLNADAWYFNQIGELSEKIVRSKQVKLVVCEYLFYSKLFDRLKGVVKVVDTHDVFADRYKIFLELGRRPQWFSTSPAQEAFALARADIVIAIQENDAEHMRSAGAKQVMALPYVPEHPTIERKHPARDVLHLCFIASNVDVNQVAISYFLNRIKPLLVRNRIPFLLTVIGSICQYVAVDGEHQHVTLLGRVAEPGPVLASQDVMLNPCVAGSGLPIKVMEALSYGLHVAGTSAGIRGVPLLDKLRAVHLCTEDDDWVKLFATLLESKRKGESIEKIAFADFKLLLDCVAASKKQLQTRIEEVCAAIDGRNK